MPARFISGSSIRKILCPNWLVARNTGLYRAFVSARTAASASGWISAGLAEVAEDQLRTGRTLCKHRRYKQPQL